MRRNVALAASAALLLPTAVLASPVDARDHSERLKTCLTERHGVKLRALMDDNGKRVRIRITHPSGSGNFDNNRIRRVQGSTYSVNHHSEKIIFTKWRDLPPTFYAKSRDIVEFGARYTLWNGKAIVLDCTLGKYPPCDDCEVAGGIIITRPRR